VTDEPMEDLSIRQNVLWQLLTDGTARLRTGERRTDTAARELLKGICADAGIDAKVTKGSGYYEAVVN